MHVGAAREGGAGAADDRHPGLRIFIEPIQRRCELASHGRTDGIPALGAVQLDRGNLIRNTVTDEGLGGFGHLLAIPVAIGLALMFGRLSNCKFERLILKVMAPL
jgi:hypothetical protein